MKKVMFTALFISAMLLVSSLAVAKVKIVSKPDKNYDFKGVKKIVVLAPTNKDCDYGKVSPDRRPKIDAILKTIKTNLQKQMIEGSKASKTTIPFVARALKKEPASTLILQYNFTKFDNGNAVVRGLSPVGGKSKVELNVKMLNGANREVVAEVVAKGSAKGGIVAGGLDSEVLWEATNIANADVYSFLKKQTGLDYDFWAGVTKGTKMGVKSYTDVAKEEKAEPALNRGKSRYKR